MQSSALRCRTLVVVIIVIVGLRAQLILFVIGLAGPDFLLAAKRKTINHHHHWLGLTRLFTAPRNGKSPIIITIGIITHHSAWSSSSSSSPSTASTRGHLGSSARLALSVGCSACALHGHPALIKHLLTVRTVFAGHINILIYEYTILIYYYIDILIY